MRILLGGHHKIIIVAGTWIAVVAITAIVSCVLVFSGGSTHRVNASTSAPDPGVQVTPGGERQAAQEESAKIGFPIKLPQSFAGPETQLTAIVTNAEDGAAHVNRLPEANLHYVVPGRTSESPIDVVDLHEVNTPVAPPPAPAQAIPLPAGTPFSLWVKTFTKDGAYSGAVYTFETTTNMVAIVFSGPTPPQQQDVIRMYESLK